MSFIINPDDKFYPQANEWMWSYCTFLGKFTDSKGVNYDLGVKHQHYPTDDGVYTEVQDATVHSNEPGDYYSGQIMYSEHETREWKVEVYRRCVILNLI